MADSFLARELLTETNHEILRHLDACPVCRADVAGRRASRERVRRAFQNARELGPTPEFTRRLRTRLEKVARSSRARRRARFHGLWALAATALLAVALGFAYRGRDRITPTGALVPAEAPPRVTSGGPIDGLSAAYFHTPREIVADDFQRWPPRRRADRWSGWSAVPNRLRRFQ